MTADLEAEYGQIPVSIRVHAREDGNSGALVAVHGQTSIALAIGKLTDYRRPGALLARMLADGPGPWTVVAIRPGGAPTEAERRGGERLLRAGRVIGHPLERLVVVGSSEQWEITLPEGDDQ